MTEIEITDEVLRAENERLRAEVCVAEHMKGEFKKACECLDRAWAERDEARAKLAALLAAVEKVAAIHPCTASSRGCSVDWPDHPEGWCLGCRLRAIEALGGAL